ncbi:MAG: nucleoside-diphosphate kinase [Patescibacteria group bacterium]
MQNEQTLVLIKPDGIQRGLIGEIISRFERSGLKLVGMKMIIPTPDFIEKHYTVDPEWLGRTGKEVLENLKKFMSSGPVVAMAWQGAHAVGIVRKLVGKTEPLNSDVGTIRGDFTIDSYQMADRDSRAVRNIIHASDESKNAKKEIGLWFKDEELLNYRLINEAILYDTNLDGILE